MDIFAILQMAFTIVKQRISFVLSKQPEYLKIKPFDPIVYIPEPTLHIANDLIDQEHAHA